MKKTHSMELRGQLTEMKSFSSWPKFAANKLVDHWESQPTECLDASRQNERQSGRFSHTMRGKEIDGADSK